MEQCRRVAFSLQNVQSDSRKATDGPFEASIDTGMADGGATIDKCNDQIEHETNFRANEECFDVA